MKQGIREKDIRDFEKYAKKLSDVMVRIRRYAPEANARLAMDDLNLMSRYCQNYPSEVQQDFIVTSVKMEAFDGGDW